MRVALDTNVLVGAVATRGLCADVFNLVLAEYELIVGEAVVIDIRDEADVVVVADAIAGRADVLVTGDRDLLEAARKLPIPIVAPRGLWEGCAGMRLAESRLGRYAPAAACGLSAAMYSGISVSQRLVSTRNAWLHVLSRQKCRPI